MGFDSYSTTPGSNTSLAGINVSENCPASGINDAIRQIAADGASLYQKAPTYQGTSGGSANAYTLATPALAAYVTGASYRFLTNFAATSTTPTLNINSLGAKTIVRPDGSALLVGDMPTGTILDVEYDGTNFRLMSVAPVGGVNAQVGTTYTVVAGDRGKLVTFTNASAIAVTLPQATTAGFGSGFVVDVENRGVGLVTITPTTSTIDGAAAAGVASGTGVRLYSDGTNYFTFRGASPLLDRVYTENTTNTALSTVIPYDDTIPQVTEGTQVLSAIITTATATERVRARFQGSIAATSTGRAVLAALFRNGAANAIAACVVYPSTPDQQMMCNIEFEDAPGTAAAQTYTVRVGASVGNATLNGVSTGRLLGGAQRATLILERIFS